MITISFRFTLYISNDVCEFSLKNLESKSAENIVIHSIRKHYPISSKHVPNVVVKRFGLESISDTDIVTIR